jgi:hypothetical protein
VLRGLIPFIDEHAIILLAYWNDGTLGDQPLSPTAVTFPATALPPEAKPIVQDPWAEVERQVASIFPPNDWADRSKLLKGYVSKSYLSTKLNHLASGLTIGFKSDTLPPIPASDLSIKKSLKFSQSDLPSCEGTRRSCHQSPCVKDRCDSVCSHRRGRRSLPWGGPASAGPAKEYPQGAHHDSDERPLWGLI